MLSSPDLQSKLQQTSVQDDKDYPSSDDKKYTSSDEYEARIRKRVNKFRLTYLFRQSFSSFCRYRESRTPHGAEVYIILLLIFLERLAYYSVVSDVTDPFFQVLHIPDVYKVLLQTFLLDIVAQLMFPVAGFLADHYLGRYRVIHGSLLLLWLGYGTLTLFSSFEVDLIHIWNGWLVLVSFILISMGSAGFQANIIPFGADQIDYRTSEELSSYFYWYYWVRNLGGLVFVLSITCSKSFLLQLHASIFGFVACAAISAALIINQFVKHRFRTSYERHKPLKLVWKVLRFVWHVQRPKNRSAFSYTGVDPPSRMDLAKEIHGGWFTDAQVEDVKTFLRLLLVLLSLMGVLVVYTGIVNVIAIQVKHMNGSFIVPNTDKTCSFSDSSVWMFNIAIILIAIPILNQCVFPFLREYTPNMRKRIGVGYVMTILSPFILLIISIVGYAQLSSRGESGNATMSCMFVQNSTNSSSNVKLPINSLFTLLPHLTVSLAEMFAIIAGLEFFYAQSPHTMRGLMIGLFFFMWGVSASGADILVFCFSYLSHVTFLTCGIWYYLVLFILAVLTFVLFLFVSRWYKNRQRGDLPPDLYYRDL